jgi:hypothetical protein
MDGAIADNRLTIEIARYFFMICSDEVEGFPKFKLKWPFTISVIATIRLIVKEEASVPHHLVNPVRKGFRQDLQDPQDKSLQRLICFHVFQNLVHQVHPVRKPADNFALVELRCGRQLWVVGRLHTSTR